MKHLGWVIGLIIILVGSGAWAQDLGENQHWIEQVGGSFAIPASSDAAQAFDPGFGGDLSVGYRLDSHLSLGIGTGYHQFNIEGPAPGTSGNLSYIPLQGTARYNFGSGNLKAYLLLSAGFAVNIATTTDSGITSSFSETDLLLSPGAGLLLVVDPKAAVFLQAKLDMDFTQSALSKDYPMLFVPIDAGLVFYLL